MAELGVVVAGLRKGFGYSQDELARLAGVSQTTIDKIERGETKRSKFLPEIAKVLGVHLSTLIDVRERITSGAPQAVSSEISENTASFVEKNPQHLPLYPTFNTVVEVLENNGVSTDLSPFYIGVRPLEMFARPTMLRLDDKCYAIYVPDDSMHPEFSAGDVLIVTPHEPMIPNTSYVFSANLGEVEIAMIARLISVKDESWIIRKWDLSGEVMLSRTPWAACHRVLARLIR